MKRNILLLFALLQIVSLSVYGQRVLFIGDSITDGNWGNSGGTAKPSSERTHWDMNHIFGSGYMYLCATHYQSNYPEKEYEFFNRGISGNTLNDLDNRWQKDAIDLHPDVISILVGTNDIHFYLQGEQQSPFDFDKWEKQYRSLLNRCIEANPHIKIVLGAPFVALTGNMRKSADFDQRDKLVRHCANIVERIAKDYAAVYLPFNAMFDEILKTTPTTNDSYWIWDGIHPTPAGHKRMSELWIERVNLDNGWR